MKLSLRYERLIVLISEGAVDGGKGRVMDERDCEALAEFSGFSAGVDADVIVTFVPGGEEELVKWVVGCMMKYCLTHVRGVEVALLQDETLVNISYSTLIWKACANEFGIVGTIPPPCWLKCLCSTTCPC